MPPTKSSASVKQRSYRVEAREQSGEPRKAATARRPVAKKRATTSKVAAAKSTPARNGAAKQSSSKASYTLAGVKRASVLLKQVSDATRLQILLLLSDAEHNVGAICNELGGQSQPAVSHHLAKLRDGRLIEPRREGKNNVYMLTEEGRLLAHTVKSLTWLKA
ncbi:metalloregulator ArsR/SmtB family transcription factor [bacterium]|nr:metalloregulator ArsR/SmtB family transcription factor [bacterium]